MNITCPNCNTTIPIDETAYAALLSQVRTKEFNEEVERRMKEISRQQEVIEESAKLKAEKEFETRLAAKDNEINRLQNDKTRLDGELQNSASKLEAALANLRNEKDSELKEAVAAKEQIISQLKQSLAAQEKETQVKVLEAQKDLNSQLNDKDKKIGELEARMKADQYASQAKELQIKELHKQQLQDKQDEIDRLKDFKLRMSTKMIGETLEQHCFLEFRRAKSYGQFPDATFEKDNTVAEGTKGDFIFRDYVDGKECVSVMFEMKNETDTTATRHKNDHFLEKLHKDREKKGCEFAVLVSMLEQGNELYDGGIVDVSFQYPKMLVIRPQFFLPVLRLISEGARKGFIETRELRAELEIARSESHDLSKFEEKINKFSTDFGKYVSAAQSKYKSAKEGIDKIITNLERQIALLREVKKNFDTSEEKLLKANEYVGEQLTVKKLTHGAPSIRKMIEEASGSDPCL